MEIRVLADGEQITENGFYQMSLDRHHSQPCDGPSVTSGTLRKMELATPDDVWAFHQLNPERWEQDDKTALLLGRAMAAYVEGGMEEVGKFFLVLPKDKPSRPTDKQLENFRAKGNGDLSGYMILPDEKPRKPTAAQIKAASTGLASPAALESVDFWQQVEDDGREALSQGEADQLLALVGRVAFWDAIEADGRTPLTDAEITMIENMGKVLASDPAAAAVMSGIPEVTMAVKDERSGLWLLARPDTVNFDGSLSDYKKMNTQGRPFNYRLVDNRITDHGYDMQMAFAAECFEALTGQWPEVVGIIAQWDAKPHHVIVREINEEDLRIGQFRNRRSIDRFAECLASGHWPGPGDDIGAYQRPKWQRDQLLEEMNTAGTAP
jgi:hypothetical protein